MKNKIRVLAAAIVLAGTYTAATFAGAPAADAKAEAPKSFPEVAGLKSEKEKVGYMIGMSMGRNLTNIKDEIDMETLVKALKDTVGGGKMLMTDQQAMQVSEVFGQQMQTKMAAKRDEEGKKNTAEGQKFLAENGKKPGIKTTESGLQYQVLRAGSGAKPTASDTVRVHYRGTLINGKEFDSSYKRNEPAEFPLGGVIPGWTEGVALMPVGSKYKMWIPSALGYGEAGGGAEIPPNATLIFEVELLDIVKADAKPEEKTAK